MSRETFALNYQVPQKGGGTGGRKNQWPRSVHHRTRIINSGELSKINFLTERKISSRPVCGVDDGNRALRINTLKQRYSARTDLFFNAAQIAREAVSSVTDRGDYSRTTRRMNIQLLDTWRFATISDTLIILNTTLINS